MVRSRFRKKNKKGGFLPVLIPIMNLFLLILPFVIQNAFLQKLTTLEMQLPSIAEASAHGGEKKVQLMLDVKVDGISIFEDEKLNSEIAAGDGFDGRLGMKLKELKKSYPNKRDIIIKVAPAVRYEMVVVVMDECRREGNLFPEIVYFDEVR